MKDSITLSPKQLECLASPVRNEAYMRLRSEGVASARQLADAMGRSPESLHYHLKALERAGLIEEACRRPAPRKPESIYRPTSRRVELPQKSGELTRKTVLAGLRQVMRGYEQAAKDPNADEHISIIRAAIRLSPKDAARFHAMLAEAGRFVQEHGSEEGLRLQWSSVVFPETKK